jgi:hypothetical protein
MVGFGRWWNTPPAPPGRRNIITHRTAKSQEENCIKNKKI